MTGPSATGLARVAAFDFDGTLVPGDSLRPYLQALLGRPRLIRGVIGSGPPMLLAYRRGGRDEAKAVLLRRVLAGVPVARAATVGLAFGATLAGRVKPELAHRVSWHRSQGHRLVLVSASLALYLDEFGRQLGFDEVIATRLAIADADAPEGAGPVLTGALDGPNVRAGEKERRLRAMLGSGPHELWAYGDSAGDREMLAMADHAYKVDGNRVLDAAGGSLA